MFLLNCWFPLLSGGKPNIELTVTDRRFWLVPLVWFVFCWVFSAFWIPTPRWKNLQAPRAIQVQLSPLVQAGVQFLAVPGLDVDPDVISFW